MVISVAFHDLAGNIAHLEKTSMDAGSPHLVHFIQVLDQVRSI